MTSVTILPSQFILQKGSRRTPAPTSEKAFTLAHISALFNDITERPSFKKNAWPLIRSPVRQDNWTSEWLGSKEPVTISTPVKYIDDSFPTRFSRESHTAFCSGEGVTDGLRGCLNASHASDSISSWEVVTAKSTLSVWNSCLACLNRGWTIGSYFLLIANSAPTYALSARSSCLCLYGGTTNIKY